MLFRAFPNRPFREIIRSNSLLFLRGMIHEEKGWVLIVHRKFLLGIRLKNIVSTNQSEVGYF